MRKFGVKKTNIRRVRFIVLHNSKTVNQKQLEGGKGREIFLQCFLLIRQVGIRNLKPS